jgi:hypothetical protein
MNRAKAVRCLGLGKQFSAGQQPQWREEGFDATKLLPGLESDRRDKWTWELAGPHNFYAFSAW